MSDDRNTPDSTASFDWEARIARRARQCGIAIEPARLAPLVEHARCVLRENDELHLTSIVEPEEFLERHLGEAFEAAALLPADVTGLMLDLGSGNGYPALPLAAARPGLRPLLTDASRRKSDFLRRLVVGGGFGETEVLEAQIQRAADLFDIDPIRVLTTRGMGGWPKIVPRLASALAPDGEVLVWAGDETVRIAGRVVWRRLEIAGRRPLPGREQSWVFLFRKAPE